MRAVLEGPAYRRNARRLRESYLLTDGATRSADFLERLGTSGRRVGRAVDGVRRSRAAAVEGGRP